MNIELIKSLLTFRTFFAFLGGIVIGYIIWELGRQTIEKIERWQLQKQKENN